MKKILLAISILISGISYSQHNWCATDEMLEESLNNNPEAIAQFYAEQAQLMNLSPAKGSQNTKAPTVIVPVVVHVIHFNGTGNITEQQIQDGIDILNEDFQKLNSDTSQTRSIFQGVAADSQIEFRLAKIDPNGNCTGGINRVSSYLTFDNRNEVKALSYWDANKYLNVWLVNSIRASSTTTGTTLGYAQFPNSGNLSTYGLVVRHDQWGSIGTANSTNGRTATHEVGHCFGLLHTFQSGCGSFCNNTGDFVCDTPPAAANTFGCNYNNNQCSNDATGGTSVNPNPYTTNVPDQLENYMSYDDCQTLFTEGQKDRMQAAFSVYSHLDNLRSAANLIATGTNTGYVAPTCPPVAYVIDKEMELICQGGSVSFTDDSYGAAVTNYLWQFPGGTPSTSTSATPTVVYNTAGTHNVTLIVSNSAGSDTTVLVDRVRVDDTSSAYIGFNYSDGFENFNQFSTDWVIQSPTGNAQWVLTTAASLNGNSSVFLDNYNNSSDTEKDYLVSPSIDLTHVLSPTFKFDVAFKNRTSSTDNLKCAISVDCGQTWITRGVISTSLMSSGTQDGSAFVPNSPNDWVPFTITTNGTIRASDNAIFRFEFTGGGGNNIFIDNFRVDGQAVGLNTVKSVENTLQLYPNPTSNGSTTLTFSLEESSNNGEIYLSDMLGKKVKQVHSGSLNSDFNSFAISTSDLSSGIYFVSIVTNNKRTTRKLIVE